MQTQVLCGRCGAALPRPDAACPRCGAAPSGGDARPRSAGVPRPKSPWLAAALAALVPGLGHIYLGRYPKGFAYLAGTGALELFGFDLDLTAIGVLVGVPMELGGVGLWLFGIADAYRTARAMRATA